MSIAPEETKAAHCKAIALIQQSRFDEALKFIEKSKLAQALLFEKAYCEYRLNRSDIALRTIDSANLNPLPANLKELKAQVLYRMEQFDECFNLYKDIIKNSSDDYEEERTTNLSAVVANMSIEGSVSGFSPQTVRNLHLFIHFRTRNSPISVRTPTSWSTTTLVPCLELESSPKLKSGSKSARRCAVSSLKKTTP